MISRIKYRITAALLFLSALIPQVLATNVTFSNSLTFTNLYGLRVPLGLETTLPPAWAFMLYNAISLGLIFFVGGYISLRNVRFGIFAIDGFAAIFWWFGWMSMYNPATNSVNWWTPLSLIILAGVMGGAIYLKEANRDRYGTGGTGLTLINILYYIILLQTIVGFVNISGIWGQNTAVTPTAYQYNNVDLGAQVSSYHNTGGFLGGLFDTITGMGMAMIQAGQMFLMVLSGIVGYDSVLLAVFPWIALSPVGVAFVMVFRVVILLLDGWFVFMIFFKPPVIDQVGV